ncbi:MAG: hypothetical protein AABX16_01660 [Nanoarchaeota archaeon]
MKNYVLTEEQAENIPGVYFPGAENELENLIFKDRDDERANPIIEWRVAGIPQSICRLTLYPEIPLPHYLDLMGNDSDMNTIKQKVEEAFKIIL